MIKSLVDVIIGILAMAFVYFVIIWHQEIAESRKHKKLGEE